MIIIIEQTIKDPGGNFEAGNRHTVGVSVTIDTAERLIASGWARLDGGVALEPAYTGDVVLSVNSGSLGQRADNVG